MNIYLIIIIVTLLLGYLLDTTADILNLKHLKPELPTEFKDTYSEEKYLKSQEYTSVQTKFGFITSAFDLIVMIAFWFSGGFEILNRIISGWSENEIIRGLIFIGILTGANFIISLPFGIYSTFVIEERFGFNKTTISTFVLDILKSAGLAILLGIPLLAGILYVIRGFGPASWLYGWGLMTLVGLIIQYVAPRWIMPLFNKFKPLEDGELKQAIVKYSDSVKFSLKDVYVMDGSKRSSKSNAFFTGFGKNKRIALFDTLIEKHSVPELVAILAHEIGHYKKKHIQVGMIISFLHTGLLFYLLSLFLQEKELYRAFFMSTEPVYAGLIFFGMLYSPIETILSILMNIISRKNEYEADNFAVITTGDSNIMITALKKLSEHNLSNLTPHPFYVFLNYSHPPVLKRIEALKT